MTTLLAVIDWSIPLKNPVLIFSLILFIILFAPLILNKFKIPHLIGLIIAGAIIGPNGFNLILRDSSIVLFGTVGLLYIMFLAGLEIDLVQFRKNKWRSLTFGLLTFIIPMTMGTLGSIYILDFPLYTSILLSSMFASHTLIAYPIISKFGVIKNRAVNIAVGGTLITDTLALLVLAIIVGLSTGEVNNDFWINLSVSIIVFITIIVFIFPIIARWFFKKFNDSISQYIFVLGMVFLGAFLAEVAGIEAIIGAFLAGLSLNKLIPSTSSLMNRIEFVGNALFIPFFLIGVGMLIDYRVFIKDFETIKVAIFMVVVATSAKFIAAWITQKTFRLSKDERRLIFGLSNAQAAATLAAVLVGYNIIIGFDITGNPIRLLNESILNGTIVMILATCTIASFVAQKGSQNIAINDASETESDNSEVFDRVLLPINNSKTIDDTLLLCGLIKSSKKKSSYHAINIINTTNQNQNDEKISEKILEEIVKKASASDLIFKPILRYDTNITNAISSTVKELKITDIIIGLENEKGISNNFTSHFHEGILTKCNTTTFLYKPSQPLTTIKRHLVFVPDKAEREIGFAFWLYRIWNIAKNSGSKLIFYSSPSTLRIIREIQKNHPIETSFIEFIDWEDFLIISRDLKNDDNMVIIMSRKDKPSYHSNMSKIPNYLNKYFREISFMLIYPIQVGVSDNNYTDFKNISLLESIEKIDEIGKTISSFFKKTNILK